MEMQMMIGCAGAAAIVGSVAAVLWLMVSGERRRAKRWCRDRGLRFGEFEFGEGRSDFWYVGIDGKGNRRVVPNGGGEAVECVREGKDGGIEFYDPREDAGARFVLTWGIVIGIAKVVLAEVAKRAIVRLAEKLLERLKEEWGISGVATADKVREIAEEMRKERRGIEDEEGKDFEMAEKVVEAMVSEARAKRIGNVEGMSGEEAFETFLSSVEGIERKVGAESEGKREACEAEGLKDSEEKELQIESEKGNGDEESCAEKREGSKVEEEELAKVLEVKTEEAEKSFEFVDGYEERGW